MIVGKLEAPARELADQRRRLEPRLEIGPDHRELAQHIGGGDLLRGRHFGDAHTTSSIMNPTIARPLSGTMQRILSPTLAESAFRNASNISQIDADPTFPVTGNVVNHFVSGIIARVLIEQADDLLAQRPRGIVAEQVVDLLRHDAADVDLFEIDADPRADDDLQQRKVL